MKTALKKKLYFCVTPQMYILLKINEQLLPVVSFFLISQAVHFLLLYLLPIRVSTEASLLTNHWTEAPLKKCSTVQRSPEKYLNYCHYRTELN